MCFAVMSFKSPTKARSICYYPQEAGVNAGIQVIVPVCCMGQVAKEAVASKKRSKEAVAYAVALAAIISVESPFVHIDGITVRAS